MPVSCNHEPIVNRANAHNTCEHCLEEIVWTGIDGDLWQLARDQQPISKDHAKWDHWPLIMFLAGIAVGILFATVMVFLFIK